MTTRRRGAAGPVVGQVDEKRYPRTRCSTRASRRRKGRQPVDLTADAAEPRQPTRRRRSGLASRLSGRGNHAPAVRGGGGRGGIHRGVTACARSKTRPSYLGRAPRRGRATPGTCTPWRPGSPASARRRGPGAGYPRRAYVIVPSVPEGTNLRAWLKSILTNAFISSYRKRRGREPAPPPASGIEDWQLAGAGPTPGHAVGGGDGARPHAGSKTNRGAAAASSTRSARRCTGRRGRLRLPEDRRVHALPARTVMSGAPRPRPASRAAPGGAGRPSGARRPSNGLISALLAFNVVFHGS